MASAPAEFVFGSIRVLGASLAGEETCIMLPELNVAFDVGRAPRDLLSIDHVFLSHGHMDHAAGIAYYFSQREFVGNAPGNLYVPATLVQPIRRLLQTWADIDGHEPPGNVQAAIPGQDIVVRRDLLVRPFGVNHPAPAGRHGQSPPYGLGFCVIEVRQKLKDEYQGLDGPALVDIKRRGEEITRRVELPLVAYCGDTAPGPFLSLDFVRTAQVLLLECTFVEADHQDRARAGAHMHVTYLRELVPTLRNERILLTHLSRRTGLAEARELVRRELSPADAERVSFLMEYRRKKR
ncbi:ribonuclease Z [Phycisphaerae bacterium RAS1]|nr:ribonuclease Z [Phycisphaerae bacterium RAS1]